LDPIDDIDAHWMTLDDIGSLLNHIWSSGRSGRYDGLLPPLRARLSSKHDLGVAHFLGQETHGTSIAVIFTCVVQSCNWALTSPVGKVTGSHRECPLEFSSEISEMDENDKIW